MLLVLVILGAALLGPLARRGSTPSHGPSGPSAKAAGPLATDGGRDKATGAGLGTDGSVTIAAPGVAPTSRAPGATEGQVPVDGIVVAPNGEPGNPGTTERPIDLRTALSRSSPADPGSAVLLRGGRYAGAFTSHLRGERDDPITVRSYPGEWAVIDGSTARAATINVQGQYVVFRDLEVTKSDPNRVSDQPTNDPTDQSRAYWAGIWIQGKGMKLVNLVVHDNGDGIGLWRDAQTTEVYGCVIFNNGWRGSDHGWGHGIYVQNQVGDKLIRDNVLFNNFGFGVHAYDRLGPIVGITIDGNTSFGNGVPSRQPQANIFAGSVDGPIDQIIVRDNVGYHREGTIGYNTLLGYPHSPQTTGARGALSVQRNTIVGGSPALTIRGWGTAAVIENLVHARSKPDAAGSVIAEVGGHRQTSDLTDSAGRYTWDENTYHDVQPGPHSSASFGVMGAAQRERYMGFADWRSATGYDASSTYRTDEPTEPRVIIRPNRYRPGRALLTVVNWSARSSVDVDLGRSGLVAGQSYEIRDVQNLFGRPVASGTFDGRPVRVPLTSATVQEPYGDTPHPVSHTSREFGAFLVLPRDGDVVG